VGLLSEFQHAARALARAPGLVAVAVISLALGIGANATRVDPLITLRSE
jgi:hypothetical protein